MGEKPATDAVEITPEMIEAGANILWNLEGEASKEALVREVYQAMEARRQAEAGS
jgi:hypothetical protein